MLYEVITRFTRQDTIGTVRGIGDQGDLGGNAVVDQQQRFIERQRGCIQRAVTVGANHFAGGEQFDQMYLPALQVTEVPGQIKGFIV